MSNHEPPTDSTQPPSDSTPPSPPAPPSEPTPPSEPAPPSPPAPPSEPAPPASDASAPPAPPAPPTAPDADNASAPATDSPFAPPAGDSPAPPAPPAGGYAPAPGAVPAGATPPPSYAAPTATAGSVPGRGMAIAALVLGILAFLGFWIPFLNIVSLIMAIVGLILGIVALRKYVAGKGLPLSAVIVNAIAAFLSLAFVILYAVGFSAFLTEFEREINSLPGAIETSEPAAPTEAPANPDTDSDADTDAGAPTGDEPGTRDNPLPLGTTVVLSELGTDTWEVSLGQPQLNATDAVLAADEFNEVPPEGFQYAVVPMTVTYVGTESASPWFSIELDFVSAAGTTHTEYDTFVFGPEPVFSDIGELFPGGTASGNWTILIPTADAAQGTWRVGSLFADGGVFFPAE